MPLTDGLLPLLMLLLFTLFAATVAFDSEGDRRRNAHASRKREGLR